MSLLGIAALTAGGSLLNALSSQRNTQRSIDFQKDLLHEQNTWNELMWNKNNDYNTPANQVARLKAAGINPNSMLSGGVSNTAEQLTSSTAPSTPVAQPLGNVVGDALTAAFTAEQVKGQEIQNRYAPEQLRASIDSTIQNTDLAKASAATQRQSAAKMQYEMECLQDKTKAECKLIYAQCDQVAQNVALMIKQGRKIDLENDVAKIASNLAKDYGIVVTHDGLTALITGLADKRSGEYLREAISNLLGEGIKGVFSGMWQGAKSLMNPVRNLFGKPSLKVKHTR